MVSRSRPSSHRQGLIKSLIIKTGSPTINAEPGRRATHEYFIITVGIFDVPGLAGAFNSCKFVTEYSNTKVIA